MVKVFEDSGDDPGPYDPGSRKTKQMSGLSAAMGIEGLEHLPERVERKRQHSATYREELGPQILDPMRDGQSPSFQQCCLRSSDPDRLQRRLLRSGIDSQRTWMTACNALPELAEHGRECRVAERLAREILYVPNFPEMSPSAVRRAARRIKDLDESCTSATST